jgi:shikimate dehydrogenase
MTAAERTRLFAVLGHPISHSLSPVLHRAASSELGLHAEYIAVDADQERFPDTLRELYERGAEGLSVTAPLKELALRRARACTQEAALAGVANCMRRGEGGFEAHNTDGNGFLNFLAEVRFELAQARTVLLGGGGAATGLAPALLKGGARVSVIARRPEVAQELAGLRDVPVHHWGSGVARSLLGKAHLVVNCTPLGASSWEELPCNPLQLSTDATTVDLRYAPRWTAWLSAAAERGCTAYDGLGLLVHQAALSLEYWLGVEPPLARLREAVGWEPKPLGASGRGETGDLPDV